MPHHCFALQANNEGPGFKKTYEDALFDCTEMGADLASIHDWDTNDYIFRMAVV